MNTLERLNELLEERELNYYQLCRQTGLSPSTFKMAARRGSQLSIDTIEAACRAMDISLGYFFATPEERRACARCGQCHCKPGRTE